LENAPSNRQGQDRRYGQRGYQKDYLEMFWIFFGLPVDEPWVNGSCVEGKKGKAGISGKSANLDKTQFGWEKHPKKKPGIGIKRSVRNCRTH
jgi:hypothetical protein